MKKLNVSEKVGGWLLNDSSGRDLFGFLLELYLEGDQDDDIDINFKEVMTITQPALEAFVECARVSNVFPLHKVRLQIFFSGLLSNDIITLANALNANKTDQILRKEELNKQVADALARLKELKGENGTSIANLNIEKILSKLTDSKIPVPDLSSVKVALDELDKLFKKD